MERFQAPKYPFSRQNTQNCTNCWKGELQFVQYLVTVCWSISRRGLPPECLLLQFSRKWSSPSAKGEEIHQWPSKVQSWAWESGQFSRKLKHRSVKATTATSEIQQRLGSSGWQTVSIWLQNRMVCPLLHFKLMPSSFPKCSCHSRR